ncbi:MAG: zf-HC2 domain-containing protein [Myxococcota bacterium]|nr:zf-HC2 domain-containing protein [Myxococcota bacterium]
MTDRWTKSLSEYLDGELDPEVASELESHLEECDDCRAAIVQLQSVVDWAESFPGIKPDRDSWPSILGEIRDTDRAVIDIGQKRQARQKPHWWKHPQALAAVFALIAVGLIGGFFIAGASRPRDQINAMIDLAQPAEGLPVSTAIHAAQTYGPAIAELETVLLEGEGILDTSTVRVLREKLDIIDQAMREAREALVKDPNSGYLVDHYTGMMRKKLTVLRSVARRAGV